MSDARADVVAVLERFDDDAWVALANRGLLRRARKDLESLDLALLPADDGVRVAVGAHEVAMDPRGPAHATCTCPSVSTCQHIVAAGLWLVDGSGEAPTEEAAGVRVSGGDEAVAEGDSAQAGGSAQTGGAWGPVGAAEPGKAAETEAPGGSDAPEGAALHAALVAIDTAALIAYAGRPAYRWARRLVEDLEPERVRVDVGRYVTIALSRPAVTFRYLGGGLDDLVADTRLPTIAKYRVVAVLACQRAHGIMLDPPEQASPRTTRGAELHESRSRLRGGTVRLVTDMVRLGLAHLSPAVHQRCTTLAVWAQGAEYHRLALMLRRLADHVELLLDRSGRADTQRLLDEIALVHALVVALEAAAGRGEEPPRLIGASRHTYDAVDEMEVLGLGAFPWHAASGYHGLTSLFWWPAQQRFCSLTDARPDSLPTFHPRRRYTAPGPWQGLASPSAATGARVRLVEAQLSREGRLSGVERTRATVTPLSGAELAAALPVVTSWADLGRRGGSVLDLPDPLRDWVVLQPVRWAPSTFDSVGQSLTWHVLDASGAVLPLVVVYSEATALLITQVERVSRRPPNGALVVARLLPGASASAQPMSLIHPRADHDPVGALHFASEAAPGEGASDQPAQRGAAGSTLRRRLRQALSPTTERDPAGDPDAAPPPVDDEGDPQPADEAAVRADAVPDTNRDRLATPPLALVDLRAWLVSQAERGTAAGSPGVIATELSDGHRRARDIGFDLFPAVSPTDYLAVELLRSVVRLQQVTLLLTGEMLAAD